MLQEIQRNELLRKANSLYELASSLGRAEDFPTDTAANLCRLVAETARYFAEALPNAPQDKLPYINALLTKYCSHLQFPQSSRIDQTPWSMVQATEQFLQSKVGEHYRFVICPQWTYNYAIEGEFVGVYRTNIRSLNSWLSVADWEARIGDLNQQKIYCISFPRIERMNVLMHVNWGHECGHILAREWTTQHFDALWQAAQPGIEAKVQSHLSSSLKNVSPIAIAFHVSQMTKEVMDLTRFTLNELISDAIGVHFFGPAIFAAITEYSSHNDLDVSPYQCGNYPPWRYRMRLMIEAILPGISSLDKTGIDSALVTYAEWISKLTSITSIATDQNVLDSNLGTKEVYALVSSQWDAIKEQVIAQLPTEHQGPYSFAGRSGVITELVKRLKCKVPPTETGTWPNTTPAELADIWNAAWAWKIEAFQNGPTEDFAVNLENLFQLTLKAIEASFVQKKYAQSLP